VNTKTKKYQKKKESRSGGFIPALYSNAAQTILTPYSMHTQVILGSYSFHIIAPLQIRFAYTLPHKNLETKKIKVLFANGFPPDIKFFFDKIITKTFGLRAPPINNILVIALKRRYPQA